jgi:parvulin-like peptidyl-prolyl isomerase
VPEGLPPAEVRGRRALAERIARDAERGNFAALAQIHSDDPSTKASGGILPYTKLAETPPVFRRVLSGLEVGRVAGPLAVPGGYAVVKLVEREESSLPEYEEAKNELAQRVYMEKMTTARRTWLDGLRRQQHVEVRL